MTAQTESIAKWNAMNYEQRISIADRWITNNRPENEYSNNIYVILFLAIKPIALKWIEEKTPTAWYKPMFV